MRSRVTANDWPTSSRVCSLPSSSPKRILMTFSSRGVRVLSTEPVCSFRFRLITASEGEITALSSMKSPRCESSSSPMGVSSEMGSWAIFRILRTLATGMSMRLAISSEVGSRPSSCTSWRLVRISLLMVSIMCTGMRMVRAWSAMARVMAWRIHHVAYVENLYPRRHSNLSTAFIRPMLPSWIRSRNCRPRLVYFLAMDTTRRRLASINSFLACSASASPRWMICSARFSSVRLTSPSLAMSRSSERRVRSSLRASAAVSPLETSARRSSFTASRSSCCSRSTVRRRRSISRFFSKGLNSIERTRRDISMRVRASVHLARR